MREILVVHIGEGEEEREFSFLNHPVRVRRIGCKGDPETALQIITGCDGQVDAIGLEDMPAQLQLGSARIEHTVGARLAAAVHQTPLVDGSGIRSALERWGLILADRAEPGIFSQKHVLMVPGLNHEGLCHAFKRHTRHIRYADPVVYFGLPDFPGVGSSKVLERVARPTLEQLKDAPFRRISPRAGKPGAARAKEPFQWADVLAGEIGAIRRYAPLRLDHKTVVVTSASEADVEDLRQRGVAILVILLPHLTNYSGRMGWGDATAEALLAAIRPQLDSPLSEDTYLDLIAGMDWTPEIRYLQPEQVGVNRFAFVIHPLNIKFIHDYPLFRWTRYLPDELVEAVAAFIPPLYISRITGGLSPTTGQRIEGYLFALGATPRQMMRRGERFTYHRLNMAARMAERRGARIMGLGAFTSVVGDAGITVAHEADIAITSGNSLTVAATLEAAKQAVIKMGVKDLTKGKAMIIGATGSIGSVCARMLAQAIYDVVLVSIEPEKLIDLKRTIQEETPGSKVVIATRANGLIGACDLVVTATSAFGQRILDITECKPGAVICDVARPPDINPEEAKLRPDVLVIESGEVLIPGDIDFGFDIGLPPKTSYACLAETALLAMEGRFEDYTLGRNISMERVKEIYRLFKKHDFQLAGLRSFEKYVTEETLVEKRRLAEELRRDPARFARLKAENKLKLAQIPERSKGVPASSGNFERKFWLASGLAVVGLILARWLNNNKKKNCP